MPTLGSHYSDDEVAIIEAAAKVTGEKRVGTYIASAVRQRLEREGFIPGTPAADVRAIAQVTAEIVGIEKVISVLETVKKQALAEEAEVVAS